MPKVTQLPTINSATNQTFFVVTDDVETRRLNYNSLVSSLNTSNLIGPSGPQGPFGPQGPTGPTGLSGRSGYSGFGSSGISGLSGYSGTSGFSGSGISGFSGRSGFSGFSGRSGYSGTSGFSGRSGFSGFSGRSGFSGSGISGFSGQSGLPGIAAFSGYSGVSGISGYSGAPGGGIGLTSRISVSTTTVSVANGNTTTTLINAFKTYALQKVQTNTASWVIIYSDAVSMAADAGRTIGIDPLPGVGVIAEVVTTSGNLTQLITPSVIGFNNDPVVNTSTYLRITNNSGFTQEINIALTVVQLES